MKWTMKNIKTSDANRVLVRAQIDRLKESIEKNGYFVGMPIVVDEDGFIVDGQHRYMACKELGISAPIVSGGDFDSVPIINSTQLKWNMQDYVTYYAVKGYEDYVILEDICKKHKISPHVAYIIIEGQAANKSDSARARHKLGARVSPVKTGEFKLKDKSEKGLAKLERKITSIISLISLLGLPRTERLIIAICRLSEDPAFSYKVMEQKIEYQRARIYRCTTIADYMHMLAIIYNNKNPKKVAL